MSDKFLTYECVLSSTTYVEKLINFLESTEHSYITFVDYSNARFLNFNIRLLIAVRKDIPVPQWLEYHDDPKLKESEEILTKKKQMYVSKIKESLTLQKEIENLWRTR